MRMSKRFGAWRNLSVAAVALLAAQTPVASACAFEQAASLTSENPADAFARASALVVQLTREEKLQLVHGYFPPMADRTPGAPLDQMIPSAGYVSGVARLGIPALRESDASLGVANQIEQRRGDVATALPSSLATAATFDPEIAHAGGVMIGSEARAKTFNVLLAGGVNLTRDPWAGRNFEYLGEDPLLAGVMAGEHIRGVQSNNIVSTIKHFAFNSQETGRMIMDARLDEAALRESDLLAFQIAIERGRPGSVMCAYNRINGDYACESDFLLNQVLKRDWGYSAWVMSDWGAVHSTDKSANSGLDQESGQELDRQIYFGEPLADAIEAGRVTEARLDDMARRILIGMIETGAMDTPVPATAQTIDYATNAEVAQRAAEAGVVLLRNEGAALPLSTKARRIVVIGGHADVGVLSGGGSSQVRSVGGAPIEIPLTSGAAASFARVTYHASSPLNAIRAVAPDAEVEFVAGDDVAAATRAAQGADAVVVFATQWTTEAQDVETLSLPNDQDALIAAVAAANPKTTVVLETGGPVLMPWIDDVPAVVQAWYPGQRGGEAIARILFGSVNPSGRLPITFPRSADQAPRPEVPGLEAMKASDAASNAGAGAALGFEPFPVQYPEGSDVGYRWYEREGHVPLFPFGHGLSYTRFQYSDLKVEGGDSLRVTFRVSNVGDREGADVPQLYVAGEGQKARRLAGWQRVSLRPGESRDVVITAEPRILAEYDTAMPGWRIAGGTYRVQIGRDALDNALGGEAELSTRTMRP
ncbi:beta-glucosidase [Brevundimonas sp. BT-123]|uniref:beta-glucosidase family protein n=1 Tax=Brevundimonas sp. BT-123 TaxID=2986928 RepID=UPI0022367A79|nr:beta-glucosidase [Brevundimonas sp. BT-123]MCW0047817.1 beta-glucosidase [Brevundimonas sp. BT-123]